MSKISRKVIFQSHGVIFDLVLNPSPPRSSTQCTQSSDLELCQDSLTYKTQFGTQFTPLVAQFCFTWVYLMPHFAM